MYRNMSRRGGQPTCASNYMKSLKTWWLSESRHTLKFCSIILLLLTLILAPWSFFNQGHREPEPRMLMSVDATIPEVYEPEPNVASNHAAPSTTHHTSPTGCLAMIMKNEGPILPRLFESVRGFVSEYCVVDTGSTDDTIDVLKSMEMPGVIFEEPFVDFATTRNYMIEKCRQVMTSCDYLVLLDADMVLRVSPEWKWAELDNQDVYNVIQVSGVEYENVRLIRRDAQNIRVVGATHEYYDVPSGYSQKTLPKALIHIDDVGDGKAKGDKFERDERLLRRELEVDPDNVRTVFYLANTLKDQGKYAEAIPYYVRRATMGGWFAEADYSLYMLSTCYDNARKYGKLAAFGDMAKRAEPLYFLAFYLSQRRQYSLAWYYVSLAAKIPKPAISVALFISYDIYNYWVEYERASLNRHIFPSQPTLGMQGAMAFWNNGYASDSLRWSFSSIMKSYVRPIIASASDVYRFTGEDESVSLAIFRSSGIVELLTMQTQSGADVTVTPFKITEVDIQSKLVREAGAVSWRMDAFSEHGIAWLFVEPRSLIGVSPSGSYLYHGEWPEGDDYTIPIHMRQLAVGAGEILLPPAWSLVHREGTTYCVSSWYPAIEVGVLKLSYSEARCEPHASHFHNPRSFSFLGPAISSVIYRGDSWFLLRVEALEAFAVVVLGPEFQLKAYTSPFTVAEDMVGESNEKESPLGFSIVISGDGKENVVFACISRGGIVIKQLPVETMQTLML